MHNYHNTHKIKTRSEKVVKTKLQNFPEIRNNVLIYLFILLAGIAAKISSHFAKRIIEVLDQHLYKLHGQLMLLSCSGNKL